MDRSLEVPQGGQTFSKTYVATESLSAKLLFNTAKPNIGKKKKIIQMTISLACSFFTFWLACGRVKDKSSTNHWFMSRSK